MVDCVLVVKGTQQEITHLRDACFEKHSHTGLASDRSRLKTWRRAVGGATGLKASSSTWSTATCQTQGTRLGSHRGVLFDGTFWGI